MSTPERGRYKKRFDFATGPLSDIARSCEVALPRRFFPRALVVRQSARPARRRARKNSRRAREKSAANGKAQALHEKEGSTFKIGCAEEGEMRSGTNLSG